MPGRQSAICLPRLQIADLPMVAPQEGGVQAPAIAPARVNVSSSPMPGLDDVPVPPELWRVAAGLSEVTCPGAAGAAPERAGIGIPAAATLLKQARVLESQPGPAPAPVAAGASPAANAAPPAAVLVPIAPAAATPTQATAALPLASPAGVPDRVAPAAAPVRQEMPAMAAAGASIPVAPAIVAGGPVVVAPALAGAPPGVPGAVAVVETPAMPAGAVATAGIGGAPSTVNAVHADAKIGTMALIPAGVAADTVQATIALERIAADPSRAEDVWAEGHLMGDDLIRFLESAPLKWVDATCTALAGLVARHCAGKIADANTLSAKVRIWLGVRYRLAKDRRCIPLYESVLAEKGLPGYTIEVALCGLAWYYRSVGEYQRALDVWLREQQLATEPSNIANGLLEAMDLYVKLGDQAKADELRRRVPSYGYAYASGIAYCQEAEVLIGQGKHDAARAVLAQPLEGRYADQVRIAIYALLARSFYMTGEYATALKWANAATEQDDRYGAALRGEGLEGAASDARQCALWIRRWRSRRIAGSPEVLRIHAFQDEPLIRREIRLSTQHPLPLAVSSSDHRIKVSLASPDPQQSLFYSERVVQVDLLTRDIHERLSGQVVVTGESGMDHVVLEVPVDVTVDSPMSVTPRSVFFRVVRKDGGRSLGS